MGPGSRLSQAKCFPGIGPWVLGIIRSRPNVSWESQGQIPNTDLLACVAFGKGGPRQGGVEESQGQIPNAVLLDKLHTGKVVPGLGLTHTPQGQFPKAQRLFEF